MSTNQARRPPAGDAEPARGPGAVAQVSVIPPVPGHDVLSYAVPEDLRGRLAEGARVLVPLGQRQVTGIVIGFDGAAPSALKPILCALDDAPLLGGELLALCRFAATYYMVPLSQVFATVVFADFRAGNRRVVRRTGMPADAVSLGPVARELLGRVPPAGAVRTTTLARSLRSSAFYAALRALAQRGLVTIEEEGTRAARARLERVFRLVREPAGPEAARLHRAPLQRRILDRLRAAGRGGLARAALGGPEASGALRVLVERGWVETETRESYRGSAGVGAAVERPLALTGAQARALGSIGEATASRRFETFLLRGVTGSGKTEVYLQATEQVLRAGRDALFLVPEIALTHELVARVCRRFGSAVALLHSGLSAGERWDEWRRLARGEARVAVGVRSGVFAPLHRLGLVVVDEEHDGAYKQEEGLRYNARDLAIVRARDASCPVVLGSATPSMESAYNARTGRYRLLELAERVERRPLPSVELVDMKKEPAEGDPAVFTPRLRDALAINLARGGQSLVFLNRRGYAHYLQCRICGHVPGCPNCSVTLTFHLKSRSLRCHHCDHHAPAPAICPECRSPEIRDYGVGTEQVEAAVRALLPAARVARMDRDTMGRKEAHKKLLDAWRERRIDVLIGTQMVTKGHDVPGVTLVGVVAADQALNFPDFRAAERTFQMLTQVAGRAGRGDEPGRVLIQTHRPTHYALVFAVDHDFEGFAERELEQRQALDYPPFSRLANVRLDGEDAGKVERVAYEATRALRAASEPIAHGRLAKVLGPAPAPIERLRGRFRWQVLVKARDSSALRAVVRPALEAVRAHARSAKVRLSLDVDPYAML